jgi:UPF0176 protein
MSQKIATFYKFIRLAPDELQPALLAACQAHHLKGTVLLAQEGINGTLSGNPESLDQFLADLRQDPNFFDLEIRYSETDRTPFDRLKVKIKPEIVSLGRPDINPAEQAGIYVTPQDWNDLIQDPDLIIIDTRKSVEITTGSFQGAIDPQINHFRQFPAYVEQHLNADQHKKIAMFCTGGIRCEKASAYLLNQGFETVYHLQGGILKYLEEIPPEQSLWQGECFVFDQRTAVTRGAQPGTQPGTQPGIQDGSFTSCPACGHPLSPKDHISVHYKEGLTCPYCHDRLTPEQHRRNQIRQQQQSFTPDPHTGKSRQKDALGDC